MISNGESRTRDGIHDAMLAQLSSLIKNAEMQSWKKDQVIFYADHKPLGIYLIESGQIAIEFPNQNEGETTYISEKHCILGLDFLLADIPYPFSARAMTPVKTWFISRHQVVAICRDTSES